MLIDRRLISHFDWGLLALTAVLVLCGIMTIHSATHSPLEEQASLASKQLTWFAIGLAAMFTAMAVDYHDLERLAYPFFYVVSLALLVLVLFIGSYGGGSQRWINLGLLALQPSEPAKLAIVLVLAKYLQYGDPLSAYRLRDLWWPAAIAAPLVLFTLIQPDLGTAVILFLVFISMVLMGGLRVRSFCYLVATGLALLPIGWQFLKPYQQKRILTFLNPDLDPLGAGYHVIQSKIAIGSGNLLGKGYLHGTQNQLEFLPAQHTDFAFSVFAEEWGFVGSLILLALYFLLIAFTLEVVARAKERFGALLVFGMVSIFFWQIVINVAMVAGLLPVVGIPLPLFSYGGSSLVTMMAAMGIIMNVSMRRFTF